MKGRINHLILDANLYEEAQRLYRQRCRKSAVQTRWPLAKTLLSGGADAGSVWVHEAEPRFRADQFHRYRVGLCKIAFACRPPAGG
jgi:hypothetical protein